MRKISDVKSSVFKTFKLDPKNPGNGCSYGQLINVVSKESEEPVAENSSFVNFIGLKLPRLELHFQDVKHPDRMYIHSFNAWDDAVYVAKEMDALGWNSFASFNKHFLEVYLGRTLDEKSPELKDITYDETKKGKAYCDSIRKMFEKTAEVYNTGNNGAPIYKTANGNFRPVWMKLLIAVKGSLVNKGNPGFPRYIGNGILELAVKDKMPDISVNPAKGESIDVNQASAVPKVPPGTPMNKQGAAIEDLEIPE